MKKIFASLLFPFLLTLITGCNQSAQNKPVNLKVINEDYQCEKKDNKTQRTMCYINLAKKEKDVNICEKLGEPETKNLCYTALAEATKNLNICNEKIIMSYSLAYIDKEQCYIGVAKASQNPKLCEMVSTQHLKEACLTLSAESKK